MRQKDMDGMSKSSKKGEEILLRLGRTEHKKVWCVMFSGLQELQNVSYPTKTSVSDFSLPRQLQSALVLHVLLTSKSQYLQKCRWPCK